MNYGIIYNEPFADYLATDCVSAHRLNDIEARPSVYHAKWLAKSAPERADTPALKFGRLFHCLALEGEDVTRARFAVAPKCDRRTKAGKEEFAAFGAANAGKDLVDEDDMTLAWRMVTAIRAKPAAVALLSRGKPEVTFRAKLEHFSVQCRVDWFDGEASAGPLCVNLKSVETLEEFDQQYERFGYYRSDAFYALVVAKVLGLHTSQPQMVNLVVEKQEPFEVSIRAPDAEAMAIGNAEVMRLLAKLDRCYSSGFWPGEPAEVRAVSLPAWKVRKAEEAMT